MKRTVLQGIGLIALLIGTAKGDLRTWVDATGKHKLEAEIVGLEEGVVTLQIASGESKQIPLEKLSDEDQKVATRWRMIARAAKDLADIGEFDRDHTTAEEKAKITAAVKAMGGMVQFQGDSLMGPGPYTLGFVSGALTDAELDHFKGLYGGNGLVGFDLILNKEITNAGLRRIGGWSGLKYLNLSAFGITDAGLVHLKKHTELEELKLRIDRMTDAGLAHLKAMKGLRKLSIEGMHMEVTNAGLAHLRGMSKLKDLTLSFDSKVTDAGLAHLAVLTDLEEIYLSIPEANDAGLAHLKGMTKLKRLSYQSLDSDIEIIQSDSSGNQVVTGSHVTKLTDAGLAHLAKLTDLEQIMLDDTEVTYAGLAHLKRLAKLRYLSLRKSPVTDAELVKKTLPQLEKVKLGD